ncbi:MAG: hypothetical protein VKJ05_03940 [Synechococcaceae cyanobacterium]|nr:hypothetical protein [Synechococcaceae cyanobacterium]
MKESIVWTALPRGLSADGKSLLLSVLLSPRLECGGPSRPLAAFPRFLHWCDQPCSVQLAFTGASSHTATVLSPPPDPDLWRALFPPDSTPVRSFTPASPGQLRIHSFPVVHVVEHLRRLYARVGVASPSELPLLEELQQKGAGSVRSGRWQRGSTNALQENGYWLDEQAEREKQLLGRFGGVGPNGLPRQALPAGPADPPMDFFRAAHFHRFKGGAFDDVAPLPDLEFHQALATLAGHPALLRRLGLLLEVSVPLTDQRAEASVRVEPPTGDQAVRVRYRLDPSQGRFLAAPRPGSDLADGWLRLRDDAFSLQQLDADGAALKAIAYADQLERRVQGRLHSTDSERQDGLPALRNGGIALVRTGRAERLAALFQTVEQANANINISQAPELFADDLTAGYRVDVQDKNGSWHSLCRRKVFYRLRRLPAGTGSIELPDPAADPARDPAAFEGTVTAAAMRPADPGSRDLFLHEALLHWDGWSLVSPRPGRMVPREGLEPQEQPGLDDPAGDPASTFLQLAIHSTPAAGSLPRLRYGSTYRLRVRSVDLAGHSLPYTSSEASQASSVLTYRRFEPVEAPTLVMVSAVPAGQLAGESLARLVIRTYNDDDSSDHAPSPETSVRLVLPPRTAVATLEQAGRLDGPTGLDGSETTWRRLRDLDATPLPELYTSNDEIPDTVPYLADPFAEAAVLRGLPGHSAEALETISFQASADGLEAQPFRLAVVEGSGPPQWDAKARLLTVPLPKSTVATVRLSCRPAPDDLDRLAVWAWIEAEAFDSDERERLRRLALDGQHWMLTPFRTLTLVHAVQRPLAAPRIEVLQPRRALADSFATLEGTVVVHAASSGKVDLLASWSEPTGLGFTRRQGQAHAFDLPVTTADATSLPWEGRRHEFGDTRHRRVRYVAVATSRFRECYESPPRRLKAAALSRSSEAFEVDVPSSARPAAPQLRYVLPTFAWEEGEGERGRYSRRRGGLRLYLEEPWFSSGDGELLGVLVWPGPSDGCPHPGPPPLAVQSPTIPRRLQPFTSQWGRDPIWDSTPTPLLPSLANFPLAVALQASLTLAEVEGETVAVAGHAVGYDEQRRLFYCDLEIDAGDSYTPFVRLALVRYQPCSIAGAEISRVLVADFAQFAPDRLCWLARDPADPLRLRVIVSGTGYRRNASFPCTSELEARLERHHGPDEGNLGWVPVSLQPVPLTNDQSLHSLALWEGQLTLPSGDPHARLRVVIEEYEAFLGDLPGLQSKPFGTGRERRLVYADALEVGGEPGLPR